LRIFLIGVGPVARAALVDCRCNSIANAETGVKLCAKRFLKAQQRW